MAAEGELRLCRSGAGNRSVIDDGGEGVASGTDRRLVENGRVEGGRGREPGTYARKAGCFATARSSSSWRPTSWPWLVVETRA